MADLYLPTALTSLFADLPRNVQVDAPTVNGAIEELDHRWPGLRDRLCEPGPAHAGRPGMATLDGRTLRRRARLKKNGRGKTGYPSPPRKG